MSNTNHPDDLSPEAKLARKFKDIVLPTITSAEARAIVTHRAGWANVSIAPAPTNKSPQYFAHTINVSDHPLGVGETPARIATFTASDYPYTPLQTLRPLEELDPNSTQYALTNQFIHDLQMVRGKKSAPAPLEGYNRLDKPSRSGFGTIYG